MNFFFQKIMGEQYRDYNDIDCNFDCSCYYTSEEKIKFLREIFYSACKTVGFAYLRDKQSVHQYIKAYYDYFEKSYIKVECLSVAPPINYYEHIELVTLSGDSIVIKVCKFEKMFLDKLFSLFYFFSEYYVDGIDRIQNAVLDLMYFSNDERIIKWILNESSDFNVMCIDKIIEDNTLHHNHYGQILYADFLIEEYFEDILNKISNFCLQSLVKDNKIVERFWNIISYSLKRISRIVGQSNNIIKDFMDK